MNPSSPRRPWATSPVLWKPWAAPWEDEEGGWGYSCRLLGAGRAPAPLYSRNCPASSQSVSVSERPVAFEQSCLGVWRGRGRGRGSPERLFLCTRVTLRKVLIKPIFCLSSSICRAGMKLFSELRKFLTVSPFGTRIFCCTPPPPAQTHYYCCIFSILLQVGSAGSWIWQLCTRQRKYFFA